VKTAAWNNHIFYSLIKNMKKMKNNQSELASRLLTYLNQFPADKKWKSIGGVERGFSMISGTNTERPMVEFEGDPDNLNAVSVENFIFNNGVIFPDPE
jgi:hypothetical protein